MAQQLLYSFPWTGRVRTEIKAGAAESGAGKGLPKGSSQESSTRRFVLQHSARASEGRGCRTELPAAGGNGCQDTWDRRNFYLCNHLGVPAQGSAEG